MIQRRMYLDPSAATQEPRIFSKEPPRKLPAESPPELADAPPGPEAAALPVKVEDGLWTEASW